MNPSSIGMLHRASIPAVMFCSENTVVRIELTCTTLMAASCLRSTGSSSTLARFPPRRASASSGVRYVYPNFSSISSAGIWLIWSSLKEMDIIKIINYPR